MARGTVIVLVLLIGCAALMRQTCQRTLNELEERVGQFQKLSRSLVVTGDLVRDSADV